MFALLQSWIGFLVFYAVIILFFLGLVKHLFTIVRGNQLSYKDKHVMITGASTGLGKEFALLVARKGGKLTIISRNPQRLEAAKKDLSLASKHSVVAVSADVTDYNATAKAVEESIKTHGPPEIVVSCAGLSHPGLLEDTTVEMFRNEIELNYFGTMNFVKAVTPAMIKNGGGKIVLVSSECGLIGFTGYAAYAASKFAVRALSDVLRNELQRYDIGVSIYWPNSMKTPGFDIEQQTKPESTKIIEDADDAMSPAMAAEILDAGLQAGQYHITVAAVSNVLRMSINGVTPRNNVFWELLINPLIPLITEIATYWIDAVARKEKKTKE